MSDSTVRPVSHELKRDLPLLVGYYYGLFEASEFLNDSQFCNLIFLSRDLGFARLPLPLLGNCIRKVHARSSGMNFVCIQFDC